MSRILVVDDEPDERFLLRRMLKRKGYEVLDASDGAAALAIVRESPPDLILTDMMMPVMDGAELIRRLRSDPATAGIPILASTGDPGLAGSADVVMSKSLPLEDLAAAVSACLRDGIAVSARLRDGTAVSAPLKEGRDPLKLMSTGIAGLDLVLNGGLERGSVVVLAGAPGTGKTILAQQICFAKATTTHRAVYYTTVSEPHTKLIRHLEPFAFFDRESLGTTVDYIHLGGFLVPGSEDGLEPLVSEIVRKTLEEEPAIVVLDSSKMLRDFADERHLRSALYEVTSRVAHTDTVLLLVGEYTPEDLANGIEFSLADGIIQLEYQAREPVDRRSLRVMKVRGTSQRPGRHTFQIGPAGIEVFPRIETLIPAEIMAASGRGTTGIAGLDELMSGGPKATDATLIAGPSGVGKTIFGLRWVAQGLEEEQHCLYVTFQDTPKQLTDMAASFGWDLGGAQAAGRLAISYVPMGDLDLDVLASVIRSELAEHKVGRVVLDSFAELVFAARESERFPAFMRSLVGLIRAAGSSSLVTSETSDRVSASQKLDRLMFLFDNVIDLRYIEEESGVGRALNVVKMRNSAHSTTLTSFTIADNGVTIGEPLAGVTGRLGWTVLRTEGPPPDAVPVPTEHA
jgi:circadian clock protein KaiC